MLGGSMKTLEERRETKAFRELQKENIRLKRLLKEARRETRTSEFERYESYAEEGLEVVQPTSEDSFACPKCGAYGLYVFPLMNAHYFKCSSCEAKGRFEEK